MSDANPTPPPADPVELQLAPIVVGLEVGTAAGLKDTFAKYFVDMKPWLERAASLAPITDATQVGEMKLARTVRLELKNIRIAADQARKSLKEDAVRYGKAADGICNVIKFAIEPVEKHLQEQEDFIERAEAARKAKLVETRAAALLVYKADPKFFNLAEMPEETFNSLLETHKQAFETAKAQAAAAEKARQDREKAEADAREAQRVENERLKAETAAKDAQIRAAEIERLKVETAARQEKDKADALLAVERKQAEDEKAKADGLLAAARASEQAALKAIADAKIASDLRAKQLADHIENERLTRDKLEAENRALKIEEERRKVQQAAETKNAPAPLRMPDLHQGDCSAAEGDRRILLTASADLRGLKCPSMKTLPGTQLSVQLRGALAQVADWLDEEIKKLPA